ncbi:oxidoreductase [Streptomyces tsukubensis]|uniref:2,4-dienoyl-CoA reductase n=1 Tax=Streptomyces tsukubensis TaxID=83656 RepID=A0A1V4AE41_9ACTN|nr:FAD-dependent oxidoreductase [Streptomyces tsukubensis]OON82302.1 2,4-dienoyl-CoA reductase [Streptomyces tsukubensis]QFR92791.1 NAD(P)-binding protein [Streptomyces tsukubensis]
MFDHVFRPGAIGGLVLPHRVVMGAMHLNLEALDDGGRALAAFYAERAGEDAGLIVTGGTAVSPAGAGGPGYGMAGDAGHRAALARAVRAVHEAGGRIALQLFHAGRYALPGAPGTDGGAPFAPSPVYSAFSRSTPRELTEEQILDTVADFGRGAAVARELGFDAVEVMGSEGYLINQFTAPATNRRDDGWGGDAGRRRRFPVEVARAVRAAAGDGFPVLFRMSGADLVEDGTPPEETAALAVALAEAGVDALAVGVGWHESPVPTVQAQVPAGTWAVYAKEVKAALRAAGHGDLPVIASNRFNRLGQADEVLATGEVDFVAMARPFLADPAIVTKSRAGRADAVNLCIACNEACIDRSFGTEPVSCLVNPRAGHESEFPLLDVVERPGRYAVIGAGVAGLEAARTLAGLGRHVEVYEAAQEPGGQFRMAAKVPGKAEFGDTIRHHERELRELGVDLRLGHRIGHRDLPMLRALDGVVLATGVLAHRPMLPGLALPHVLDYQQAFADPDALGPRVAVIGGGGIAVDLAHLLTADPDVKAEPEEFLAAHAVTGAVAAGGGAGGVGAGGGTALAERPGALGRTPRRVTLMRRGRRVGAGIGPSTRWVVMRELRAAGVELLTGVGYEEITREGVLVREAEGGLRLVEADHVVLASGQEPELDVAVTLGRAGVPFETAGGAAGTERLNAVRATAEGLRAAHRIVRRGRPSRP